MVELRETIHVYRVQIARGEQPSKAVIDQTRRAYLSLGGDPEPPAFSLKDYDHERYGPFLGVSDEGSAVAAIRQAAYASPKCVAFAGVRKLTPDLVGVAIDAERLGGIGEVAVGPDEYADIWTGAVDRLLVTTNIGTRINLRVYRREPRVLLTETTASAIAVAKAEIATAFKPFVKTPDGKARPLTVFIDIPRYARITRQQKIVALRRLVRYVASGKAAGYARCPDGQSLGLAAWVRLGLPGRDDSFDAIELAAAVGMKTVIIDGVKRKQADSAVSLAGLLEYFAPGIVGPILRRAKKCGVTVRAANLPDTDTIARSIWSGLQTARSMGAHLGKYGTFPLTLAETDGVVAQVQNWFRDWSAAPVLFLDQGVLRDTAVDVEHDLERGAKIWLDMIAAHRAPIALLDTIEKSSGRRLVKMSSKDRMGCLTWSQIERIKDYARERNIKLLWAGGLSLRDAFEMGKHGVFGIYVTSAAADAVAVPESYTHDPMLSSVKEPSSAAMLHAKMLLEAGFLSVRVEESSGESIRCSARALVTALTSEVPNVIRAHASRLASACVRGWQAHARAGVYLAIRD